MGSVNLSYEAAYTTYSIADVPVSFRYHTIRDFLRDAADGAAKDAPAEDGTVKDTKTSALSLPHLDPATKAITEALDAILLDHSSLMAVVDEVKRAVLNGSKAPLSRLLSDCIQKKYSPLTGRGIEELTAMGGGLFASLFGIDLSEKNTFTPHGLSPETARHMADQLKAIAEKYVTLSVDGKT